MSNSFFPHFAGDLILKSNITAPLLSPQLPQSRRKTSHNILGKNKAFFSASTSVQLHSNAVRPSCSLYCFNVITHTGLTTSGSPL